LLFVFALGVAGSGFVALLRAEAEFPHAKHEGLFPLCSGCHGGIETGGDPAQWYPQPQSCATCHDGEREDTVSWTAPTQTSSNLDFVHADHVRLLTREGDSASCSTCHQDPAGEGRMSVAAATAESCLTCHTHEAPEHLANDRDCMSCHLPLAEAEQLSVAQIAAIEQPATHLSPEFLSSHEPLSGLEASSCATCHTRESCERCHFNGSSLPAVSSLGSDARVAGLVAGRSPIYPEPSSHVEPSWEWLHGDASAAAGANCANCHTRPSCESCHTSGTQAEVVALPTLPPSDGRGISLPERASLVHPAGFSTTHGTASASLESSCSGCHAESSGTACHDGASKPGFHVGNFLQSHAPEAYGNATDCASCHNTEVFCRSCHIEVGLAAAGRSGSAFHDARPLWLLGHGLAARQGLESCTSCHSQSSCMQCHSAVGSWRINPHGADFDPARALDSPSKATCGLCHQTGIPG
jgi:hypothetical protein